MAGGQLTAEIAFHLRQGMDKERRGDLAAAIDNYLRALRMNPRDARLALFAGPASQMAGRGEEAAAVFSLGDDADPMTRAAKDRPDVDPELRGRSAVAERGLRRHFTKL